MKPTISKWFALSLMVLSCFAWGNSHAYSALKLPAESAELSEKFTLPAASGTLENENTALFPELLEDLLGPQCLGSICVGDTVYASSAPRPCDTWRVVWIYNNGLVLVVNLHTDTTATYTAQQLSLAPYRPAPSPYCNFGFCVGDLVQVLNAAPENPDRIGRVHVIQSNGTIQIINPENGRISYLPYGMLQRMAGY